MFSTPGSVTWLSIISNSSLAVLNIATAVVVGNGGVLSDDIDTSADVFSAFIAFVGIRIKGAGSCSDMNYS